MRRLDAIRAVYPELDGCVGGHDHGRGRGGAAGDRASAELLLSAARDGARVVDGARRSRSTRPELPVVVFDGDGSILMNLGGLTTLARYRPRNLVHVVFDNESLLSVGGFPTATSTGSDIAAMAAAAGVPRAATVRTVDEFVAAFDDARRGPGAHDDRGEGRGEGPPDS